MASYSTTANILFLCERENLATQWFASVIKPCIGETMAEVGGGCHVPGDIQGEARPGSEHPDQDADVSAQCRKVDL